MTPDSLIDHEELRIAGDDLCNMYRREAKAKPLREWARYRPMPKIVHLVDLSV